MADKEASILPVGTHVAGYAKASLGPFYCGGCQHFDIGPPSHCEHPLIMSDFDVPHSSGKALVEFNACCNYFRKR